MNNYSDIYSAVNDIISAYNLDMPENYKRRDRKEPGRVDKEMYEDKLARLIKRRFNVQKEKISTVLNWLLPHKSIDDYIGSIPELNDPETEKKIFNLFIGMMALGRQLFSMNIGFGINWSQYDEEASAWAKKYLHEEMEEGLQGFFDALDETTMSKLKQELGNFVEMEGYTIGDVMNGLNNTVLGGDRAQRVAVTEITRVYAESDDIAGKIVEEEYPGVKVIKTWFTNNDSLVCPICGPMNEVSVLRKDLFPNGLDGPPAHPNCRCWRSTGTDITGSVELG